MNQFQLFRLFICTGDAEVSAANTGAAATANTDSEKSRNGATDTNREVPGQKICSQPLNFTLKQKDKG